MINKNTDNAKSKNTVMRRDDLSKKTINQLRKATLNKAILGKSKNQTKINYHHFE